MVHGVFKEGGGGEDRQTDRRAGRSAVAQRWRSPTKCRGEKRGCPLSGRRDRTEGAGDGEDEASGFAKEGEDVKEFGGHTSVGRCQPVDGTRRTEGVTEPSRSTDTEAHGVSQRIFL